MTERLQRYGLLRLFVVFVVIALGYGTNWLTNVGVATSIGPFAALGAAATVVILTTNVWMRRHSVGTGFVYAQIVLDVAFTSALCHLTGALHSLGQVVYLLAIGAGASLLGLGGAVATATLCSLGFLIVLAIEPILASGREDQMVLYTEAMFRVFGFLLMAGVTGYAAETLQRERRSTQRLAYQHETVLERVNAGVLTIDAVGLIRSLNPAGFHMFGEVIDRPVQEALPGLSRARPPGDTWEERVTGDRLLVCSAADLPEGGQVVVAEDVTDITRMRQEAQRIERLAGAGRLAASVAHEIRNPLASISGCIQMMAEEHPSRIATLALAEAERLNRLVEDYLAMTRPPAVARAWMDVRGVTAEVADTFGRNRRYEGQVTVVCEGDSAYAFIDPDRLRQTLWNLLLNGAQAMPGGGRLWLTTTDARPGPDGRMGIEIRVRDEGGGISAEDRERIFDPLYTTRTGGSGIGLALVYSVVKAHEGTIEVHPPAEGGAEFTLWLPKGEANGA